MLRHPLDLISKRYQLRTFFLVTTGICVALWLATFTLGQLVLGLLATIASLILALACATWVVGTFGEQQKRCVDTTTSSAADEPPTVATAEPGSQIASADRIDC